MELALASEWAEWCRSSERGVYVAPAPSGREWHGLHFISSGAFAGAVFAFELIIPAGWVPIIRGARLSRTSFAAPPCLVATRAHPRHHRADADIPTRCLAAGFSRRCSTRRFETESWTCRRTQRSGPRANKS